VSQLCDHIHFFTSHQTLKYLLNYSELIFVCSCYSSRCFSCIAAKSLKVFIFLTTVALFNLINFISVIKFIVRFYFGESHVFNFPALSILILLRNLTINESVRKNKLNTPASQIHYKQILVFK